MKTFRILSLLFVTSLFITTACKKKEVEQTENLIQTGILGKWKLDMRLVNNISDLAIRCCDTLNFMTDSNIADFKGDFKATGVGYETDGIFTLNPTANTIQFDYNNKQIIYTFQLSVNRITFEYIEDEQEIEESWMKVD